MKGIERIGDIPPYVINILLLILKAHSAIFP